MSIRSTKSRIAIATLAALVVASLCVPSLALAVVRVDQTELAQGENAVGGGTAKLVDTALEMSNVTAIDLYTDQDLIVDFKGGNDIENVNVAGSANVELGFSGKNEVEEVHASENSNVTINANGLNDFEEVTAQDQSNLTINVTGENEFEEIVGTDDANITIRGTDCQKKDEIELGDDEEDTGISTERGSLTIDHVTIEIEAKEAVIGSDEGDVVIDTSKIEGDDDNKYTLVKAGGKMDIVESVIEITGTVYSKGKMTIRHSDVEVEAPDSEYADGYPYRVMSATGIELIDEENGEVKEADTEDGKVYYVDTDDGEDVDLEADGDPAYYKCKGKGKSIPGTGDSSNPIQSAGAAFTGGAIAIGLALALRRREDA